MRRTVFIKNALILTVSSLILRFLGIIFKVWLASRIGSEGIGLYQLIFSFYVLAATFATSGITTAVTRLIADELALGSKRGVNILFRRCLALTLLAAAVSVAAILLAAEPIARIVVGDMRAVAALRILSLSLPFMGASACVKGYFLARRKASPNATAQIFEQLVRIGVVFALVSRFTQRGVAFCCAAVLFGDTVAEICSFGLLYLVYLRDRRQLKTLSGRERPPYAVTRRILHIALPISAGKYLNSALRTAENALVPKNLAKYRPGSQSALSQFGMIKGMALPVLFFPSTLLMAVSTLLVPEISEAIAKKQMGIVRSVSETVLRVTALTGYIFAGLFFSCGEEAGQLIFHSADVGFLIRALAPIVPLMYLDSVSDGILKGLDRQLFSFRTSVCDSVLRIVLILIFLPITGLWGFIGIMYVSNLLTCLLNVGKLMQESRARLKVFSEILLPQALAYCVCILFSGLLRRVLHPSYLVYIIFMCVLCLPVYFLMLYLTGSVRTDDLRALFRGRS